MAIRVLKNIANITKYKKVFLETKPSYWVDFVKHTYMPKKDNIKAYQNVPNNIVFSFLNINVASMCSHINKNESIRNRIITRADRICEGHVIVFNIETEKVLGQWSTDPLTRYTWPMIFFNEVRKITPQGTVDNFNDIKYPWELSNSHFLVTLSQAFLLTGDKKYYDTFFLYINDWKKENPVGMGVNWCCTMDVALRAINIIIAASIMNAKEEEFSEEFKSYYELLYSHMLFIKDNLEFGFVRENHFLSDIVGLKMIAQCFREDSISKKYYDYASNYLRNEILYQICSDGVDHEASSCYHGFVLELFMIAIATDRQLRSRLTEREIVRLVKMCEFSKLLCQFETYPIIGDNDSGRVMDLNGGDSFRREIVCFAENVLGIDNSSQNEYCFLIDGDIGFTNQWGRNEEGVYQFHEGGYVICSTDDCRFLLHAGSIGRKGKGGHGHNDQTSFVLEVNGVSLIVDPGSMVYERDLKQRHKYRGTMAHNCITLNKQEQNKISIKRPFKMENNTNASFKVENKPGMIQICAKHRGYEQSLKCNCVREVCIQKGSVAIKDIIEGDFCGGFDSKYYFSPWLNVSVKGQEVHIKKNAQLVATMKFDESVIIKLGKDEISPEYGVGIEAFFINVSGNKAVRRIESKVQIIFN